MMHEQTMRGGSPNTDYSADPTPGRGNRNTDWQESGNRGFYNQWDGGGAGGWHGPPSQRGNDGGMRQLSGSYVGRGPKGYRRTDARILEDVYRALTDDDQLDASDIEISINNGVVELAGTAHSRDDRRRAERLLDHIVGLTDVQNNIKINAINQQIGA